MNWGGMGEGKKTECVENRDTKKRKAKRIGGRERGFF